MQKKIIIAPSLLNSNFLNLKENLQLLKNQNVKWIHYDVMDYDFVPNLTFGPKILSDIKSFVKNDIFLDCHMMVKIKNMSVENYLKPFIDAGTNSITMHFESLSKEQLNEFLLLKKKYFINLSLALKPSTSINKIIPFLSKIDMVLIMSVEPGFGEQKFIKSILIKINKLNKIISDNKYNLLVQIDGGIDDNIAKLCKKENVDVLVVGSYLFSSKTSSEFKEKITKLI